MNHKVIVDLVKDDIVYEHKFLTVSPKPSKIWEAHCVNAGCGVLLTGPTEVQCLAWAISKEQEECHWGIGNTLKKLLEAKL